MKKLIYIISILLGGCMPPSSWLKEVHQRIEKQVKLLIDSGYLTMPYIEIYEIVSNDSNIMYRIGNSDSPASMNAELPSRVMKYKEHFLCFIELDEPEISRTELFQQGIVADSAFRENLFLKDTCYWLLACRKYEDKQTLVRVDIPQIIGLSDEPYKTIFDYPELWSYFSGGKQYGKPALMVLDSHDIIVSESYAQDIYDLEVNNFEQYIERFSGEIFVRNLTGATLTLSCGLDTKKHYVVVNGADTLNLHLKDSLPITIKAHEYKYLEYESECPRSFLRKISGKDTWMSMYNLFCDSTFCFLNINGVFQKSKIMHNDTQWQNYMKGSLPTNSRLFFNKNIDDKEERNYRFFKHEFRSAL